MVFGIFDAAFEKRSLPPYTRVRWRGMVRCGPLAAKARKSMAVETSFAGALVRECTNRVWRTSRRARRCCQMVAWLYLDLGISRTVQKKRFWRLGIHVLNLSSAKYFLVCRLFYLNNYYVFCASISILFSILHVKRLRSNTSHNRQKADHDALLELSDFWDGSCRLWFDLLFRCHSGLLLPLLIFPAPSGDPGLAVDGVRSRDNPARRCFQGQSSPPDGGQVWRVDLGVTRQISRVRITSRYVTKTANVFKVHSTKFSKRRATEETKREREREKRGERRRRSKFNICSPVGGMSKLNQ